MSEGLDRFEVTVAAPVEEVWRALREPEQIRRWFGWEYDGLADEVDQIFQGGVEAEEEGRSLTFVSGERVELEQRGNETVIKVTRSAPAPGSDWEDMYYEMGEGWRSFLQQLRFALERHPGEPRRTIHLDGGGGPQDPRAALGVAELSQRQPGERYESASKVGETLSGTIAFVSRDQLGLTADAYGDGLVVLAAKPEGSGRVIVTTYGLDDDAFAALERRWQDWWSAG